MTRVPLFGMLVILSKSRFLTSVWIAIAPDSMDETSASPALWLAGGTDAMAGAIGAAASMIVLAATTLQR